MDELSLVAGGFNWDKVAVAVGAVAGLSAGVSGLTGGTGVAAAAGGFVGGFGFTVVSDGWE